MLLNIDATNASTTGSSAEPLAILATLLRELLADLSLEAGAVLLLDPQTKQLSLVAVQGLSWLYQDRRLRALAESPLDREVLTRGAPLTSSELSAWEEPPFPDQARGEGMRFAVVLPLATADEQLGTVHLYSAQLRQFQTDTLSAALARCRRAADSMRQQRPAAPTESGLTLPQRWRATWRRLLRHLLPRQLHDHQRLQDEPPGRISA